MRTQASATEVAAMVVPDIRHTLQWVLSTGATFRQNFLIQRVGSWWGGIGLGFSRPKRGTAVISA
jgi:hypothetical protein